jgi:hypothetical protein
MAPAPGLKESVFQEVRGFLGVNLRQERASLADEDVATAINADLHSFPGVLVVRAGRTAQFASALAGAIRRLARVNSVRYQVAGQALFRNQVSILTALHPNLMTTLLPFRPLNDTTLWTFIADDALMRKDDGTNLRTWGIAAPTTAPSVVAGAAGSLTGTYSVKYTYVRKVGSSVAHESNPSPVSGDVTLSSQALSVSSLVDSTDPQVTHKRIYRTLAGGTTWLYDQEVAQGTLTATSSQADTALGTAVETDNDPPPEASWAAEFGGTVLLCRDADNPHYLWYTKRFRPESVPTGNFLEIGNPDDPLQCAIPLAGLVGVFSRLTKYRVTGNATSGFVAEQALSRRGTPAPLAAIATEQGIAFVARDGIFLTNLIAADQELSAKIAGLFFGEDINGISRINWAAAETMSAAMWKGRLYMALPTGSNTSPDLLAVYSSQTRNWYFYDHACRSLAVEEDLDDLVAGFADGITYILEDGASDAGTGISLDAETKDYFGQSLDTRKLFIFFRVDTDVLSGTLTADFYVDGALKRSVSITGTRTKRLLPLPEATMGYSWRVRFRYTGTERAKVYGAAALWLPLEAS